MGREGGRCERDGEKVEETKVKRRKERSKRKRIKRRIKECEGDRC